MDIKDQLKDIPIDQVAESLGLDLKKHGVNLQGDCPTGHPSKHHRCFSINSQDNFFHCFSCGAGGDVISLVELVKGLDFQGAMRWLAEQFRRDLLPELDRTRLEARPELREFYQRVQDIQSYHSKLRLRYILPTFMDRRVKQAGELLTQLQRLFNRQLCLPIRYNIRLSEASGHGQTIFEYAPRSEGAEDYQKLIERIQGE